MTNPTPPRDLVEHPHLVWWVAILGSLGLLGAISLSDAGYRLFADHVTAIFPQWSLQILFVAAWLLHVFEASYAYTIAKQVGCEKSAAGWTLQTFLIGFPSLRLLLAKR